MAKNLRQFKRCAYHPRNGATAPITNREQRMAVGRGDAAFVVFDHVQKSYDGETLVVKDLNLEIAKGEFLTMLGPSGSGKTTCLMMLAGFETATHGEILLAGRPINNIPPHRRGIGMVFQNYALFPHMTVGENLAFPLEVRKMAKADDRGQGRARPRHGADGPLRRPPSGAALRRPAAAHRARPRPRLRRRARADGRAARRPRQAAPRAHAVRDQAPARAARRHRRLRHPRPVRGADHVGPRRRLQRRPHPAARARPRISTSGRPTASSPSSSARTTRSPAPSRPSPATAARSASATAR